MRVLAEFPWVADPAAIVVLSLDGLSYKEALAPGRVSFVIPVPAGDVLATRSDARIGAWLDAGASVLLHFECLDDARRWNALLDSEIAAQASGKPPVVQ